MVEYRYPITYQLLHEFKNKVLKIAEKHQLPIYDIEVGYYLKGPTCVLHDEETPNFKIIIDNIPYFMELNAPTYNCVPYANIESRILQVLLEHVDSIKNLEKETKGEL